MFGTSMGIQRLRRHIQKVAGVSVPVLIRERRARARS